MKKNMKEKKKKDCITLQIVLIVSVYKKTNILCFTTDCYLTNIITNWYSQNTCIDSLYMTRIRHTLKCLSIGTPKTINFPFVSN